MSGELVEQPKQPKNYKISPKMEIALEALSSGAASSIAEAAQTAGLSSRAVRFALKRDNIKKWLQARTAELLNTGQVQAARTMLGLLRSSNSMSQFRAASFVLGVNGIAPPAEKAPLVNISIGEQKAGFVIDLSEPGDSRPAAPAHPIIDVTPAKVVRASKDAYCERCRIDPCQCSSWPVVP